MEIQTVTNKLTPKQKMLRLAAYLEDHVPPSEFDMAVWKCGSVGCALGHAVTIFPDELCLVLSFQKDYLVVDLKNSIAADSYDAGAKVFNINREEAMVLFYPYYPSTEGTIPKKKTKDSVVNDLRKFANNKWPDEIVEEIIEKVPVGEIQNV